MFDDFWDNNCQSCFWLVSDSLKGTCEYCVDGSINLSLQIFQGMASTYYRWSAHFMHGFVKCWFQDIPANFFIEIGSYLTDTEKKKTVGTVFLDTVYFCYQFIASTTDTRVAESVSGHLQRASLYHLLQHLQPDSHLTLTLPYIYWFIAEQTIGRLGHLSVCLWLCDSQCSPRGYWPLLQKTWHAVTVSAGMAVSMCLSVGRLTRSNTDL